MRYPVSQGQCKVRLAVAKRQLKVTTLMLLQICADTMIGNQLIRGISGGQRKRVTTGQPQYGLVATQLHPNAQLRFCIPYVHVGVVMTVFVPRRQILLCDARSGQRKSPAVLTRGQATL